MRRVFIATLLATLQCFLLLPTKSFQTPPWFAKGLCRPRFLELGSMGSDVLVRPDDEDSPEFREYLKALMKLQATRAKSGGAAPSSGSSDAYIAKLNRLKVERMALRQAGLPDAALDTSYKEEDYKAAIYEAQEPLISNSVLTGEAAKPGARRSSGNKVRSLTAEEISIQQAAEESVRRALEKQQALGPLKLPAEKEVEKPDYLRKVMESQGPETELIDQVLGGLLGGPSRASPPAPSRPQAPVAPRVPSPQPVSARAPAPTPAPSPAPALASASATATARAPTMAAGPARVAASATRTETPLPKPSNVQAPESPSLRTGSSSTAEQNQDVARNLTADEMQTAAEALQFVVKHRGGGPFGMGRLAGSEARQLQASLQQVASILAKDTATAFSERKEQSGVQRVSAPVPAPVQASAAPPAMKVWPPAPAPALALAPAPAPLTLTRPPSPAVAPVSVPVPLAPPAAVQAEAEAETVPIAKGLDDFLRSPKSLSVEELSALRDGLIQCLSLIQGELSSRPAQGPSFVPAQAVVDPTIRIAKMTAGAIPEAAENASPATATIEREVRLALGLLLKHRGGPGFGHGRLDGRELELMEQKLRDVAEKLVLEAL